jgi:rubrerythrin
MAISFVKKLKDVTPQNSVKFLLHQHLNGAEPARPLKRIHASELTKEAGFCPRYYALHDVTKKKPKDRWLTTSENVTFRMGRDLQDAVVHWFADMGKAIAHWQCLGCGHMHQFTLRPHKCEICGSKSFKPDEVRFESAISGASCGIDMLVNLGEPKLRPVEIKTMEKDQFKELKAPLAEHKQRTNLYLRIIDESEQHWSNLVNTQKATVLYVSKSGYGCSDPGLAKWGLSEKFSPFKEWDITRDDKLTEEPTRRSLIVKNFREKLIGMPCGICTTSMSKRAIGCEFKKDCWSGDYPPEYEWAPK